MKSPYTVTTVIFTGIAVAGVWFLDWRNENFAFLLLLYFIVTLGIKLDDLSVQIGIPDQDRKYPIQEEDTVIKQLARINASLDALNETLNNLVKKNDPIDAGHADTRAGRHSYEKNHYRSEMPEE